ncbi:hypothetical protein ACFV9C_42540 [Kribbella sp. NPDC059898]|uniref:hypothetical protein n=1 Tax=Kribbella sp. NPDC059898 TaxID=3346995 RepID=UPI0036646B55
MVKEVRGVRWFTAARRVPSLIGRMHDGTMIKGGPYTLVQAFVMPITAALAWWTRGMWGTGSWIFDGGISLGVAVGLAWVAGQMPDDRNPILWAGGLLSALTQPRWGRSNGRRVTVPKPQRIHGHLVVQCSQSPHPVADLRLEASAVVVPAQVARAEPAATAALVSRPVLEAEPEPAVVPSGMPLAVRHTGVEALLAAINQGEHR